MKSKGRFILDTNVLVSAVLIGNSRPAEAFRKARQLGEILLSLTVAEELNEVLGREKFDRTSLAKTGSDFWPLLFKRQDSSKQQSRSPLAAIPKMTSFWNSPSAATRLAL